jgi:hypothetical protein
MYKILGVFYINFIIAKVDYLDTDLENYFKLSFKIDANLWGY